MKKFFKKLFGGYIFIRIFAFNNIVKQLNN